MHYGIQAETDTSSAFLSTHACTMLQPRQETLKLMRSTFHISRPITCRVGTWDHKMRNAPEDVFDHAMSSWPETCI